MFHMSNTLFRGGSSRKSRRAIVPSRGWRSSALLVPLCVLGLGATAFSSASGASLRSMSGVQPKAAVAHMAHAPMTVWFSGSAQEAAIVQRLLAPWGRSNHASVTVTPLSSSNFTTEIDTAIAGGTLPNLIDLSQGYPDIYGIDGLAVNISQTDPSLAAYISSHSPTALAYGNTVYNGSVYGALEDAQPYYVYVNTAALKKYNLPLPTTWSVLDNQDLPIMKKDGLGYVASNSEWYYYPVLFEYGGALYAKNGLTIELDTKAALQAAEVYLAAITKDGYSTSGAPAQTMADLFAQGKYPIVMSGPGFLANIAQVPNFSSWEMENYPAGPKGFYAWTGGTSLMAFKHGTGTDLEEMSLMSYMWGPRVQHAMSVEFDKQASNLYLSANISAWSSLKLPGISAHNLAVMKEGIARSLGDNAFSEVKYASIMGLGNSWQTVQDYFDKMAVPNVTTAQLASLLKGADTALQDATHLAGK
ncbi:MAG: extracellular solute-binding protein [Actinobacteria bacterium]|nr:extracellular solute-binding protein [Actinomycetota bacterium]